MSLIKFAKAELRAAGLFDPDADFDGAVAHNVVSLIETFVAAGHSGGSGALTRELFAKLAAHQPITPLTGEEDEWTDCGLAGAPLWVNNRCHNVFKDNDRAWIVHEKSASLKERIDYITFPYTVK